MTPADVLQRVKHDPAYSWREALIDLLEMGSEGQRSSPAADTGPSDSSAADDAPKQED